jgi:hypothetical protein
MGWPGEAARVLTLDGGRAVPAIGLPGARPEVGVPG